MPGVEAIEGFDYQAIAILELALEHFEIHRSGSVRPEGLDDAELRLAAGDDGVRHVQVKKPVRMTDGVRKPTTWTVAAVATGLLLHTFQRLADRPAARQVWVLGDDVEPAVRALLAAGTDAPTQTPSAYLRAMHFMALEQAKIRGDLRQSLSRWEPNGSAHTLVAHIQAECEAFNVEASTGLAYRDACTSIDAHLPAVLARVELRAVNGEEEEVRQRVVERLVGQLHVARPVAQDALARNLRGYINDIAKQRRAFSLEELEVEVRDIWPHMVAVKDPPLPPRHHVLRPQLVAAVQALMAGPAVEIVALSGAGKTALASELIAALDLSGSTALYSPVRIDTTFRDLLAGLGYVLRRYGHNALFSIVTQANGDETAIQRAAHAILESNVALCVVIDAVDGSVSEGFARDLAELIRLLEGGAARVVALGQTPLLRAIKPSERRALGIQSTPLLGFSEDEFVVLASRLGASDRAALGEVFNKVTAGRTGGMLARDAVALARLPVSKMAEIASLPAEQTMAAAERARFDSVPPALRASAERVVCMLLPFRPGDLAELFPDEAIPGAIADLESRGLLERYEPERVEMHESVRRPLEALVRPSLLRSTHRKLADYFAKAGQIAVQLLHLDRAEEPDEAKLVARAAFREGRQRRALVGFVIEHGLFAEGEVVEWFRGNDFARDWHLLPNLIASVGNQDTGAKLVEILVANSVRVEREPFWARQLMEAVLRCDAAQVDALADFALAGSDDLRMMHVVVSMRRLRIDSTVSVEATFRAGSHEIKRRLLSLLLGTSRMAGLRAALNFAVEHGIDPPLENRALELLVDTTEDAERILGALPIVGEETLVLNRSPQVGRLAEPLWRRREQLTRTCRRIVMQAASVESARQVVAAIRLLWFFGDRSLIELAKRIPASSDAKFLAEVVPMFFGDRTELPALEQRVLDRGLTWEERAKAFLVGSILGLDSAAVWRRLAALAPDDIEKWEGLFVPTLVYNAFPEGAGVLDRALQRPAAGKFLGAICNSFALVPGSEVTGMLVRNLEHSEPAVRFACGLALGTRRAHEALEPLLHAASREEDERIRVGLTLAALACQPTDIAPFLRQTGSTANAWPQLVLAGRLRASACGPMLVAVARDELAPWSMRRAAIASAARLNAAEWLDAIATTVLNEANGLTDDSDLNAHWILLACLGGGASELESFALHNDRESFVSRVLPRYESLRQQSSLSCPVGSVALGWMWASLCQGVGQSPRGAANWVRDRLQLPALHAAIIRGYRLRGDVSRLEELVVSAPNAWFAFRALMERIGMEQFDVATVERLGALIDRRPPSEHGRLRALLLDRRRPGLRVQRPQRDPLPDPSPRIDAFRVREMLRLDAVSQAVAIDDSIERMAELVVELAPGNDTFVVVDAAPAPEVILVHGYYSLRQSQRTFRCVDNRSAARAALRPAVAVASPLSSSISWHEDALGDSAYVEGLVASVVCRGDRDSLLRLVEREPVFLLKLNESLASRLRPFVDERLVPHLRRFVRAGTVEAFNVLCLIASCIDADDVELLLAELLQRWVREREAGGALSSDSDMYLLKALARLSENSRLLKTPLAVESLLRAVQIKCPPYVRSSVVSLLAGCVNAYARLEMVLLNLSTTTHLWNDEVDVVDEACDAMFRSGS